ncbi:hypothetical protein [Pseudomonas aeruginosa]|uniref:hypothetical protein n=1 Tax=Pseudomonas aeruginosa TaxID=287 RepID=UPI001E2B1738|nr:hypothetical protein [Pseudomonas aeruginosa]MCC9290076.1 hypothetical protein [Pseudomonas aeruginosa]UVN19078.1 hypothetical protein [Pseudomonas aeruginosa]
MAKQVEMALDSFERDLVQGSTKKAMSGSKSRDLWQINPLELQFMPAFNTRTPRAGLEAHIPALADSMKSVGYYQDMPIAVNIAREGEQEVKYVTDGHCRTNAVLLANQEGAEIVTIRAVPEERVVSLQDLTVKLFRSNSALPLTPYESGLVCKWLIRYGLVLDVVADRIGLGTAYVDGLLMLVAGPKFIRDAVIDVRISATVAVKLFKTHGDNAVEVHEQMLAAAQGQGRSNATAEHAPAAAIKRVVMKLSDSLYHAAKTDRQDPGYTSLAVKTGLLLDVLLRTLDKAEKDLASGNPEVHEEAEHQA